MCRWMGLLNGQFSQIILPPQKNPQNKTGFLIDEVSSPADSLVPLLKVLQSPDINFPLFCVSSTLYHCFLGIESKVLEASVSRP